MNAIIETIRTDVIRCPRCETVQYADVEKTPYAPRPAFVSGCVKCEYVITESEWNEVSETDKLRWQLEGAVHFINAATDIMTPEQVGRWTGIRAFLESLD